MLHAICYPLASMWRRRRRGAGAGGNVWDEWKDQTRQPKECTVFNLFIYTSLILHRRSSNVEKNKAGRISDSSFPVCLFPLMRTGGRLYSRTLPRRRKLFKLFLQLLSNTFTVNTKLWATGRKKQNIIPYHLAWGQGGVFHIKFSPNQHKTSKLEWEEQE